MKNLIKKLTLFLALTSFTSIYSQQFNIVYNNTSSFNVRVVVYDASNNQIGMPFVISASSSGSVGCTNGVPSYIHFIEVDDPFPGCGTGGCLWSANVNTSGNCSTCTSCNCWSTTSPFFANTLTANTGCQPIANELSITITP